ncbi:MAG: bifunctional lysylphosphatidylglycerol flippase/synthetase MprF [Paracoccaceae bacterium]
MSQISQQPGVGTGGRHLWSRLRNFAPVILGLSLFALGLYALYHLLAPVRAADVFAQVRATHWGALGAALLATIAGYCALIGYDWSALRYLDRKLPFRIVAVGGFLGYSFGNSIGVAAISGGAVRYRIYSAFGLNAYEVAAVSTFVSLAFGVGITVIGLGALAIHPLALGDFLPWGGQSIRLGAIAILLGSVVVLTWLSISGKSLKIRSFEVRMPSPGILYGQLGFTALDTAMAALTLYVLLPAAAPDYVTFLAIFAAATMIGVASHVPGGVGVFESVIIASMPAAVPVEQAAAALLLFRLIYYLVPFGLAMIFVALNEARLASGPIARLLGDVSEQMEPVMRAITSVTPTVSGTATFGLGFYLLLSALMPGVRPDQIDPNDLLAAVLLEGGAIFSAVLGVVLIMLAQGLYRRISGAYWLTLMALAGGAVATLLNGLDFESAALLLGAAIVMLPLRREFFRSAKLTHNMLSPGWFALIAGIALSTGAFLFLMHEATPYSTELWIRFSGPANTPRALRAALTASALLTFFMVYIALQPARTRNTAPDADAMQKAAAIIAAQDDPEAHLALSGDKSLLFSENGDAFLMYAVQGRSWIVYADPIGPPVAARELSWAFYDLAYSANGRPVFYEVSEKFLGLWVEMGLTLHKIGEEAVVRLPEFSLSGAKFKKMRAAHNKALKSGLDFAVLLPPHSPALLAELKQVSDAWLGQKNAHEKGFSVGRFDEEYLSRFPIAIVRREGRIMAFSNVMSADDGRNLSIDLMRYLPDEADGIMEFLFVEMMQHYRDAGGQSFSLGMAPLAGLEARHGTRLWTRFGAILFRHGGSFYNFAGLRAYKQKFQPEWRPRYLAVPGGTPPLLALKDVTVLIAGSAKGLISR